MIQITVSSSSTFPNQKELADALKSKVREIISDGLWLKKVDDISFSVEVTEGSGTLVPSTVVA
jgi:hypothetical protein